MRLVRRRDEYAAHSLTAGLRNRRSQVRILSGALRKPSYGWVFRFSSFRAFNPREPRPCRALVAPLRGGRPGVGLQ